MKVQPNVVQLMDAELCRNCRFGVLVRTRDRAVPDVVRETIFCRRLDCDNWDRKTMVPFEGELVFDIDEFL